MDMKDFDSACELLPEGVTWDEAITPCIVKHIAKAAQARQTSTDEFANGIAYACARLVEIFDQPTMAKEIMQESGADFSKIDEADGKFLMDVL